MRVVFPSILLLVSVSGCSRWLDYDAVTFSDASCHDGGPPLDARSDAIPQPDAKDTGVPDANPDAHPDGVPDALTDTPPSEPAPTPCDGVTCSNLGTCEVLDGGATCTCNSGYHAEGLSCVADESCDGVECGTCSTCKVIDGKATCTCPDGFSRQNGGCWPDPDPCDTTDCGPDAVCVPVSHCGVYGGCHQKCDCSNCGNCDGPDWIQYCGSDSYPPTTTCNQPCPPGSGCCMFSQPFCWPGECCQSL